MQSVTLLEHQSAWPREFTEVAAEIAVLFSSNPVSVEHIGSTSVPGLCAKPVLDIMLGTSDLSIVSARSAGLLELGYRYRPEYEVEIPERRYFVRAEGPGLRVHLHALVEGGAQWRNHLTFRDALRNDAELMQEYAALKRQLALRHSVDKAAYTLAKAPFIRRVLADARMAS